MTTETVQELRPTPDNRRGLGLLLASTGVAITGQGMVLTAGPLLAASLTRNPLAVSVVTAASYAAWLIIGLPSGALVDRWPLRAVMVITDLLRCVVLAIFAVLTVTGHAAVWSLTITVFLVGVGNCFFDPASQSAIPALVGRNSAALAHANGKLWALDTFGRGLIGPPLGAAAFGFAAALPFGVESAAFLASALFLSGLPRLGRSARPSRSPLSSDVREGVAFVAKHAELRALTLGMAAYNLGYSVSFAPLVLFAQDKLHLSNLGFGALVGTMAVGGVLGGWTGPRAAKRLSARAVYAIVLAAQGLAWLTIVLSHNAIAAGCALFVVGLASTTVSVVGGSARQLLTPDHLLGRMVSVVRLLGVGSAAVGALVGGAVATAAGIGAPFFATFGLLLLVAVIFAWSARRASTHP